MEEPLYIAALDIGSSKVTACIGTLSDTQDISVVGVGTTRSEGIKNGVVINIEAAKNAIKDAIEQAELMAGVVVEDLYLSISGQHINSINSKGVIAISNRNRTIGEDEVRRVIDAAKAVMIPSDHEIIHVLAREFTVDDQSGIKDPIGMTGIRLEAEVHIITGLRTAIKNLYKVVAERGYGIADIVFSPLAASEVVLSEDEKELGVILVDIGGGTSDIMMYLEGGVFYSGCLPIGGFHVSNDISIGLKTPFPSAEDIKIKYGCANPALVDAAEFIHVPSVGGRSERKLYRQELCQIIEPRMEELAELIDEKVMQTGKKAFLSAGIVLTGGAINLEGSLDIFERVMNISPRSGYPDNISGLKDFSKDPSLTTAVGLVRYGARHRRWNHFQGNGQSGGFLQRLTSKIISWFEE